MKRTLLVLITTLLVVNVWAQSDSKKDLIYKTDYEVIEAKIIEVSSSEVKYKEWNNQDGPTFVLKTHEIGKIKYSNGTEKMYATAAVASQNDDASSEVSATSDKSTDKTKMEFGFQANVDAEGNLAFIDKYAFGGVDLTLGAGVRMGKFLYVGAAAGVLGEWGAPKQTIADKEIELTSSSYIVPIYADARVYAPAKSGCYPFAEVGIGGFVGLDSKLLGEDYELSSKPKNGFYLVSGVGLEFKYVTIGAGYKLIRNEDIGGGINSRNHGYVKVGISLGRPNKLR